MANDRASELVGMSRDEFVEQAVRFAYANARMSNPNITENMIRTEAFAMFDSRKDKNKG
tara:strand:- start:554 stop:730 length:177 start_codon:yes stop_codon:yes gene_type:complete